jgi:hypothetical protein
MADRRGNWKKAVLAALSLIVSGSVRASLNTASNHDSKRSESALEFPPEIMSELVELGYLRVNPANWAYELTVPMLKALESSDSSHRLRKTPHFNLLLEAAASTAVFPQLKK